MLFYHDLSLQVTAAITAAQAASALPAFDVPAIKIEHPRDPAHGDYSSAVPLQLARVARMAPMKIAQAIAAHFPAVDYLEEVTAAPPGFLNIRLRLATVQQLVNGIIDSGQQFGALSIGKDQKIQIECVSANPTGPITLGRTRGGVIGDTLARIMRAAGYTVELEYYYNPLKGFIRNENYPDKEVCQYGANYVYPWKKEMKNVA